MSCADHHLKSVSSFKRCCSEAVLRNLSEAQQALAIAKKKIVHYAVVVHEQLKSMFASCNERPCILLTTASRYQIFWLQNGRARTRVSLHSMRLRRRISSRARLSGYNDTVNAWAYSLCRRLIWKSPFLATQACKEKMSFALEAVFRLKKDLQQAIVMESRSKLAAQIERMSAYEGQLSEIMNR